MPKRYTVQDSRSGKTITFDWHGGADPTESDMAEISDQADVGGLGNAVDEARKMGIGVDAQRPYGESLPARPFKDARDFDQPIPPSNTQMLTRLGARVAPAVAGSYYGGQVGAVAGPWGIPVGAAVGGILGGALGETGAEELEKQPGQGQTRTELNPRQIGLQGLIAGLPLPFKGGGSLVGDALGHAVQGGLVGGGAAALTPLAEGQLPQLSDVLSQAGIGALMGGTTSAALNKFHAPTPEVTPPVTPPKTPPIPFDPAQPSMASPSATPMGFGPPSSTAEAVPASAPIEGVRPPVVDNPAVNQVPTPNPRTPLAWMLKPTSADTAGSWTVPTPGGMVQGQDGRWSPQGGRPGGTTTSMEIPLQDFEATGAWDRQARAGAPAMGPEPPVEPQAPPPDAASSLPPGPGPEGPGPEGGAPEAPRAPGEDNTTAGLRTMLKQAVDAGDQESARKIAFEINRRQQAQRGFMDAGMVSRVGGAAAGGVAGAASAGPDATLEDRIAAGLGGAAMGGLGGHMLAKGLSGAGAKLAEGSGIPELTAQREAQAAGATPLQKAPILDRVRTNLMDSLDPVRAGVEKLSTTSGVRPPSDSGWENIYNIRGGQGGRVAVLKDRYDNVAKAATASKLNGWLTEHLNLVGMGSSLDTLSEKARAFAAAGDQGAADAIWDKIRTGKALPELAGTKLDQQKVGDLRAEFDKRAGAKLPEIQALGKQVTDLQRESVQTMMDAGLIRPEVGSALLKRGDYIPMSRIMDAVAEQSKFARGSSMQLKAQRVLFNLEGSERVNKDPLKAAFGRHAEILYEAGRNEAAQNVASWSTLSPEWEQQFRDISRGGAPKRGEVAIGYYDKGERKTLAVPEPIGTALMTANSSDIDGVFRTMGKFNNFLRQTAITLSPSFAVKNMLRDSGDTRMLGQGMKRYNPIDAAKYVGEWVGMLKDTMAHDINWQNMMNARAGYGTLARQFGEDTLMAAESHNPLVKLKEGMGHIGNTIEENTKSVGFKRLKAQGLSDVDAAFETRQNIGSPDFARKGALGSRLGVLQTFFNASLQGISRSVTRLSDPKVLAPVLAGATLTALARDKWNRQFVDSDGVPALEKISDNDRKNYYVMVNPFVPQYEKDGVKRYVVTKLVKGHAAQLVSTPIEELIDAYHGGKNAKDPLQIGADTLSNLMPGNTQLDAKHLGQSAIFGQLGSTNPAIKAVASQLANRDFAFGQPVVPERLAGASAPEQWDERTSPTIVKGTQWADKNLGMNLSPMRMQQGLKDLGVLAGPGEMALSVSDKAIGWPLSKRQPQGPDALAQTPVVGPLARAFVGSTLDQTKRNNEENFYDALEAGKVAIRDKNLAIERRDPKALASFQIGAGGSPNDPGKLADLVTASYMLKASQQLSALRKASREATMQGTDSATLNRLTQAEDQIIQGALRARKLARKRFGLPDKDE